MKSIYQYRNYREALLEFYESKKKEGSQYSYAIFAKKAGLGSPNYLKLVIDGKRNLTVSNIHAFASVMKLRGGEIDYFESLVLLEQASTPLEKKYYMKKLNDIKRSNAVRIVRKKTSSLLGDSYLPAVLLCTSGKIKEEGAKFSSQELGLNLAEATKYIDKLIAEGSLSYSDNKTLHFLPKNEMIHDPYHVDSRQKAFLDSGLEEAKKTFAERYPEGAAKFLSLLLTAPEGSLPDLFEQMRSAAEKMSEDFNPAEGQGVGVYRFQMQVYRLKRNEN